MFGSLSSIRSDHTISRRTSARRFGAYAHAIFSLREISWVSVRVEFLLEHTPEFVVGRSDTIDRLQRLHENPITRISICRITSRLIRQIVADYSNLGTPAGEGPQLKSNR